MTGCQRGDRGIGCQRHPGDIRQPDGQITGRCSARVGESNGHESLLATDQTTRQDRWTRTDHRSQGNDDETDWNRQRGSFARGERERHQRLQHGAIHRSEGVIQQDGTIAAERVGDRQLNFNIARNTRRGGHKPGQWDVAEVVNLNLTGQWDSWDDSHP